MRGRVLTVNVAAGPTVGRRGPTGIDKRPADGPVAVRAEGLAGDTIIDLAHHGGVDQAVYAYAAEDLGFWAAELAMPVTGVGENLTLSGVECSHAVLGERWLVGSAVLVVRSPRIPCRTFAEHLGVPDLVRRFAAARRPGCYMAVERTGVVAAGDVVELMTRPAHGVTVADAMDALLGDRAARQRVLVVQRHLGVRARDMLAGRGPDLSHIVSRSGPAAV